MSMDNAFWLIVALAASNDDVDPCDEMDPCDEDTEPVLSSSSSSEDESSSELESESSELSSLDCLPFNSVSSEKPASSSLSTSVSYSDSDSSPSCSDAIPSSTRSLDPPLCASHTLVLSAALTASMTTTASAAPSTPPARLAIISDSVSTCEHKVSARGVGTHSASAPSRSRHVDRLASRPPDPRRRSPMPPSGAAPPSDSLPYALSISPRVPGDECASPTLSSSSLSSATRWSFRVDITPTTDDAASAYTSEFSPSMNQVMPAAPCSMADRSALCRRTNVRYFFMNPATPAFGAAGDDAMAAGAGPF